MVFNSPLRAWSDWFDYDHFEGLCLALQVEMSMFETVSVESDFLDELDARQDLANPGCIG